MPANGVKKRGARPSRVKSARDALNTARRALSEAHRSGDAGKIEKAERARAIAAKSVDDSNLARFEALASVRTAAAVNAIEELIKLANQRRYALEPRHSIVIETAIGDSMGALHDALQAALRRRELVQTQRKSIVFAEAAVP